jgi:predicted RNA-binding protein
VFGNGRIVCAIIYYKKPIIGRLCMCETNVYVVADGEEELVIESVDVVRPEDGKVYLRNLFGEEKVFDGGIKEISLRRNRIVLKR